ncbi:MAG: alpha/beta hydrolase [Acidimicrobiia bacterium]|nr:alpha/beta hydrolase [Acidimicrobiia bacterium]
MSTYVGINPLGLIGLADTADGYATRVGLVASQVESAGSSDSTSLREVSTGLVRCADELRWRSRVIELIQADPPGPARLSSPHWLGEFAATALVSLDRWPESFVDWRARQWIALQHDAEAGAVAAAFATVSPDQQRHLVAAVPEAVATLDGVPPDVRYAASRMLVELEIDRLESLAERLEGEASAASQTMLRRLRDRADEYRGWLEDGRRILLFDPTGDGRVVEVFGDLTSARRLAVIVPGMANDLGNYADPNGLRTNATSLHTAASEPGTATIAWLGYDTPDGVDALGLTAAEEGASALQRFLAGIDPQGRLEVTVVAHSYGSVVAGMASAGGLEADNLVFVGSPGTTLDHAGQADLRPNGRVWAALAPGDPIVLGVDPIPPAWWRRIRLPILTLATLLPCADHLWHGPNPAAEGFGADRLTTDGSFGHTRYFEAGTLANLARIVGGRYDEVELVR